MMRTALANALEQLDDILIELERMPGQLADNVYLEANIGQHIRHVFDHMFAIKAAIVEGIVDYDKRDRGNEVETDRLVARQQLALLRLWIQTEDFDDRKIVVSSEIDCENTQPMRFNSNLYREILYVINHTIHHAAHIKLVLAQFGITLPKHVGIAPGTATFNRHRKQDEKIPCAH